MNKYDEIIAEISNMAKEAGAEFDMKVVDNGKTVVDIRNGEDQLKKNSEKEGCMRVPKCFLTEEGLVKYDTDETKELDFVYVPYADLIAQPSTEDSKVDVKNTESVTETLEPSDDKMDPEEEEDDSEETYGPGEKFFEVTKNISKDEFDETYIVRESANGFRLTTETEIIFDYTGEDGITTPGVTDGDLAMILLYRNRNNKERYDAILNFLKLL